MSIARSLRIPLLLSIVSSALPSAWGQVMPTPEQQQEFVGSHNRWRADKGVPPLRWAADLSDSALEWAVALGRQNNCEMQHSKGRGNVGENLYWASAVTWSSGRRDIQAVSPQKIVDAWGEEIADYDYGSNNCRPGKVCGHYTQVIWKNTREVGCAGYVCPGKDQVWVCQYRPAGNYIGQKPY